MRMCRCGHEEYDHFCDEEAEYYHTMMAEESTHIPADCYECKCPSFEDAT